MNNNLFPSQSNSTVNAAGGSAVAMTSKRALAQLVVTGGLSNTFYVSAKENLDQIKKLAIEVVKVDSQFVAKLAVYARKNAFMKDTSAFLLAVLGCHSAFKDDFKNAFPLVIDDEKMLKNFVQVIRSGVLGRKSFGTSMKNTINKWLGNRNNVNLFKGSIGNEPSLADVIRLTHPNGKAVSPEKDATYKYILGYDLSEEEKSNLPALVKQFEAWKADKSQEMPAVPFQMLTAQPLNTAQWTEIAKNSSWTTLRMNLNTFQRHGLLTNGEVSTFIAERLGDANEVARAKVFPYQLFTTFLNETTGNGMIKNALEKATNASLKSIPEYSGNLVICLDTSGSMSTGVLEQSGKHSSVTRCNQVASLFAAAILEKNPNAKLITFTTSALWFNKPERGSVLKLATQLSNLPSGGTDCASPLRLINNSGTKVDTVIMLSDNESWASQNNEHLPQAWKTLKANNPNAKMVCIDLAPNTTVQVKDNKDILNVGGFSDTVFTVCNKFICGLMSPDVWLLEINKINLLSTP